MKSLCKTLLNGVAGLLVLPALLGYGVGIMLLGRGRAFPGWSQALSLLPGTAGVYLRRAFYRFALGGCAADCHIGFGTIFSCPGAEVGRGVYVGAYCCLGEITLDEDVLVSSHVSIINGGQQHGIERLDVPIREQPGKFTRIRVGCDSWIGERAVVLADVGKKCVIGAGAVVTRPIPDNAIAVGVPARVIRFRGAAEAGRIGAGPAASEGT